MFELDSALMADSIMIGDFPLSRLLIHRDANYPWFILVPRIAGVTEIYHLSEQDQYQLIRESSLLAETLVAVFSPDKVNIATLGNRVPQLHVHHIARYKSDAAWPDPIWGRVPAKTYTGQVFAGRVDPVVNELARGDFTVLLKQPF
ncbi:HIT domain-containing protein [Porticoccus sp.]|uniref:HIT domain-containing protein n=1 Tax=Porticoccus sp. TaxID=2024853 RepID=UPI003F69E0CB